MTAQERVYQAACTIGHRAVERAGGVHVEIAAPDGLTVRVDFIADVLEWYYTVVDAEGRELVSYWDDLNQGVPEQSKAELQQLLASAAIRFISAVTGARLRIARVPGLRLLGREFFVRKKLELQRGDTWADAEDLLYPDGAFEAELAELRAAAG